MVVAVAVFLGVAAPAAGAHSDPALIAALDEDGRYLERTEPGLDATLDEVNSRGVAFAWLDQAGDAAVAVSLSDDYVEDLQEIDSRYHTVVVLTSDGFAASSTIYTQQEIDAALDASFDDFRAGAAGDGMTTFNRVLTGSTADTTATTGSADTSSSGSGGGGIGLGTILLAIAAAGGVLLLLRGFSTRRKAKRQAKIDMENDRAEIKEQLKANADRVIYLGDRVIAKGDDQLITRYEEASKTYQEVSLSVDGASTAAEVDALDDRIDHAEWQFETIEAGLSGLPTPPSPREREAAAAAEAAQVAAGGRQSGPPPPGQAPPPPQGPADGSVATSPRTGRRYPRTTGARRRTGTMGGMGGMGGILGSILGSVVLGGGLGGGNRSQRSQRRDGLDDIFGRSGGLGQRVGSGGGLGGGVLRRGGRSSRSTSSAGRNRRSGRSRSRGGRSF